MMAITEDGKYFDFVQTTRCNVCGRYGAYRVFHSNEQYYMRTTCCNKLYELDPEIGKAIAQGETVLIRQEHLQRISKVTYGHNYKHCDYCGYETAEKPEYCPKCGKKF